MATRNGQSRGGARRRYSEADWNDFAHTGPGTLAGRFMRRFWHPVYLARDLKPGRPVPVQIMGEDFTLYRGEISASPLAAILRSELHTDDIRERPDAVTIQDNVAQRGQGVIRDTANEHLGMTDVLVVLFRSIWARELRALAEGRPLKEWRKADSLAATYGT
jgi:hypothetical protein